MKKLKQLLAGVDYRGTRALVDDLMQQEQKMQATPATILARTANYDRMDYSELCAIAAYASADVLLAVLENFEHKNIDQNIMHHIIFNSNTTPEVLLSILDHFDSNKVTAWVIGWIAGNPHAATPEMLITILNHFDDARIGYKTISCIARNPKITLEVLLVALEHIDDQKFNRSALLELAQFTDDIAAVWIAMVSHMPNQKIDHIICRLLQMRLEQLPDARRKIIAILLGNQTLRTKIMQINPNNGMDDNPMGIVQQRLVKQLQTMCAQAIALQLKQDGLVMASHAATSRLDEHQIKQKIAAEQAVLAQAGKLVTDNLESSNQQSLQ